MGAHESSTVNTFTHPPRIESIHIPVLEKRAISKEFALLSGVSSRADNELRNVGFDASIPNDQKDNGLQGICFAYRDPRTGTPLSWRLRPDQKFNLNGHDAKYLSRRGDTMRAYFPHTVTVEHLDNGKVPCVITEGEFKALALAEGLTKIKRDMMVIGLAGVNGGWHREKENFPQPDGTIEKRSVGPAKLLDDLTDITWKNRTVYICFDSDVGTHKHAVEFKRSRYAGAMGAEQILAELLRARGAEVRIVPLPHPRTGDKIGIDDYIVLHGAWDAYKRITTAWLARRDPDEIIHRPATGSVVLVSARALRDKQPDRPIFVIDELIPEGGTAILAGAPKTGKSGIALNAAKSVCEGKPFLGRFMTRAGRVAYIQTEIPDWALSQRLKLMGDIPEGLLIFSPTQFHLNCYEDQGFKRTETGNADRIGVLVDVLKQQSVSLVIFDPLAHFHTLNENNVEHVSHLFQIFRTIARPVRCGVLIVHHHRKVARSVVRYEGAEDLRGSIALYAEPDSIISVYSQERSDDTRRFKLLCSTRHAEEPEPLELVRLSGDNSMLWTSKKWSEAANMDHSSFENNKILRTLQAGPLPAAKIIEESGITRRTVYRRLDELTEGGKLHKSGNLYFIAGDYDDNVL